MNNAMTTALKQAKAQAELVTHLQSIALKEEKKKCEGLQEKVRQLEAEVIQLKHDEQYNESVLEFHEELFEKLAGIFFQGKPGSAQQVIWFDYLDSDGREYIVAKNMEERNNRALQEFEPEPVIVIKPKKRDNLVIEIEQETTRATEFEMLQRQTKRYNSWKK